MANCRPLFSNEDAEKQGQAAMLKLMFSFAESLAVKAALLLKLPDIMVSKGGSPMSVAEIAENLPTSPPAEGVDALHRLMRFLAATAFLTLHHSNDNKNNKAELRYSLSEAAKCLVRRPGAASMADIFLFVNDEDALAPWHHFHECVMGGGEAFVYAHGANMWQYNAVNDRFNAVFNDGMAARSELQTQSLLSSYDGFGSVSSLVDVGGGTGSLAAHIVKRHPNISSAINLDLPHVIATAPKHPGVEHMGGDMFKSIPSAECIVLNRVLHDWTDSKCLQILKACLAVLPPYGRLVILDMVVPDDADADENVDKNMDTNTKMKAKAVLTIDLLMMAHAPGGHERSATQWTELLSAGGFSTINIIPLPPPAIQTVIEAFP